MTESPHAERDDWAIEGSAITSPAILEALQALLDHHAVIVERGYYRGSRAPERCFFNDYEEFSGWLKTLSPGDVVYVWDFDENCRDDNTVAAGKVPDADGRVPRGGAY